MNILDKIIAHKKKELEERKSLYPVKLLEKSIYFQTPTVSFSHYLKRSDKSGIIAEFKRQSPSKGPINPYASVEEVSIGYMQAGASALSVLTDEQFFCGKSEDLRTARSFNYCPILRKDFIIDEYQIVEARSIGADVILLIAACLSPQETEKLARFAKDLGLEVLLEVHDEAELASHPNPFVDAVGVNNRNLQDFTVSIETSERLAPQIPSDFVKVSESGLSKPESIIRLKKSGFQGFLIGEHFMRNAHPAQACQQFIRAVQSLEKQTEVPA